MKLKICDVDGSAQEKLPPGFEDKSGIGVHYVDAWIKPLNTALEDGRKISCKRRGLKLTLAVGESTGSGLMRRLDVSPDPRVMLEVALTEAAKEAGVQLHVDEGAVYLVE